MSDYFINKNLKSRLLGGGIVLVLAATSFRLSAQQAGFPLVGSVATDATISKPGSNDLSATTSEMVVLLVDKTALKAKLVSWPSSQADSVVLKDFTVAIGKEKGDKQKRGDNKTPEGIYLTEDVLDGKGLPDRYGPYAIPLNYPNPMDRFAGKTGYGIWLHGVIKDDRIEEANVTEGCVAFYNADITQLIDWLRPDQGVVVIAESLKDVNRVDDVTHVRDAFDSWYRAWADRNLDLYIDHYSEDFKNSGMDRVAYRDFKDRVFKRYRNMQVNMQNVRVLTHPKYAVTFMDQDFSGDDQYKSIGRKILYWQRSAQGRWKILKEIHENKRFQFVKFNIKETSEGKQASVVRGETAAASGSTL